MNILFALAAIALAALVGGLLLFFQPRWIVERLASRDPDVLYFVETGERVVALTIDDGPSDGTGEILDVLARHDAPATWFLISSHLPGREQLVREMIERGHELANHLTHDERAALLPIDEFERKLLEAHEVLSAYQEMRWMRPGGAWFSRRMLDIVRAHGYHCVLGTFYPLDQIVPWPEFNVGHVLANLEPGAIFVLHDGTTGRARRAVATLEALLPRLAEMGYRVVTVSDLVDGP